MTVSARFSKPVFVVNPNSANGSTGRDWPAIAELASRAFPNMETKFTQRAYEAPAIVRDALRNGADLIVSVGGDGTHNEVVNGFFEGVEPIRSDAALGVLSRGTGGDLRKTLGLEQCMGRALEDVVNSLVKCRAAPCDVGRIQYTDHQDAPADRYFINIASFGIGGEVDEAVNRSSKALGGKASFFIGSLKASLRYRNRNVTIKVDGRDVYNGRIYNVAVANGRFFGGGMMVAPQAELDDGLFDIVLCQDYGFADSLRLARTIYSGAHLALPKTTSLRGKRLEAISDERVLLDVDGEQPGKLRAAFEILPRAIQILRF
jgi:diacylglycerol kinase (ATP)